MALWDDSNGVRRELYAKFIVEFPVYVEVWRIRVSVCPVRVAYSSQFPSGIPGGGILRMEISGRFQIFRIIRANVLSACGQSLEQLHFLQVQYIVRMAHHYIADQFAGLQSIVHALNAHPQVIKNSHFLVLAFIWRFTGISPFGQVIYHLCEEMPLFAISR